jgi:chromosome partitioning protein
MRVRRRDRGINSGGTRRNSVQRGSGQGGTGAGSNDEHPPNPVEALIAALPVSPPAAPFDFQEAESDSILAPALPLGPRRSSPEDSDDMEAAEPTIGPLDAPSAVEPPAASPPATPPPLTASDQSEGATFPQVEQTIDSSGPLAVEPAPPEPTPPQPITFEPETQAPVAAVTQSDEAFTPPSVSRHSAPLEPESVVIEAEPIAPVIPEPVASPELNEVAVPTEPRRRTPSIRQDPEDLLAPERPPTKELPRVIAIANQKGGVGKTTTTVNLGAALAEMDYRVLVVDLDPQGNATTGLGIDARNFEMSMYDVIMRDQPLEDCIEPTSVKNLFVAPATIDLAGIEIELVPAFSREMKLKRAIDSVVDDFDFILIDCPPSLGLITVNGLAAAGEVLVPIQCEYYALEGLSQLLRNVKLVSTNLNATLEVSTIVLTMYDARTRLSVDVAKEVREHFASRVCKSVIPRTVRLSEAPSFGQPITVFDPTSRGAMAYRDLAKEVSNGATKRTG